MWHSERKQILEEALDWCHHNQIEPNSMGILIALDELGYLRAEHERLKWVALTKGGSPYIVGPIDDPPEVLVEPV